MTVNKTTIKMVIDGCERTYRLLGRSKPVFSVEGLFSTTKEAMTNVATGFVRSGPKTKLTPADIPLIKEMREAGMTQAAIAEKLGIHRETLRRYIQDMPDIATNRTGIMKALKEYFSSGSEQARNEAFPIIDKYLENLAREMTKKGSLSYEDCIQDLRLRFFELVNAKEKGEVSSIKSFFNYFFRKPKATPPGITTVPLSSLDDTAKEIASSDFGIAYFEAENLGDFLLEAEKISIWGLEGGSFRNQRLHRIVIEHLKEDKSFEEIGEMFGLTDERVRKLFANAKPIIEKKYPIAINGENYEQRIKMYQEHIKNIIKEQGG